MHEVQNAAGRNDGGQQDSNDGPLFHGRSSPRMKIDFSSRLGCPLFLRCLRCLPFRRSTGKCWSLQMKQGPVT
jgi:hypothetical protein